MEKYGVELILDMHGCDSSTFTRESIGRYFKRLCELIDMKREALYFWDDIGVPEEERQTLPHTQGTSAVQFILTSSIIIHTLDQLAAVYVNIFSCKEFDTEASLSDLKTRFSLAEVKVWTLERGLEYSAPRTAYHGMVRERVHLMVTPRPEDA